MVLRRLAAIKIYPSTAYKAQDIFTHMRNIAAQPREHIIRSPPTKYACAHIQFVATNAVPSRSNAAFAHIHKYVLCAIRT
jgi:hypothetical protein